MQAALARAKQGRPAAAVISGPPGIGKSRLCDALVESAEAQEFRVARAGAWELGGAPAYWPWTQLLRQLSLTPEALSASDRRRLSMVLPELLDAPDSASAGSGASFELYDAVARLLSAKTRSESWLLIFEDLHAADPSSVRLLAFLQQALRSGRVLFVLTRREQAWRQRVADAPFFAEALRGVDEIALGPLDRAAACELASALGGALGDVLLDALLARTGGHPLFLSGLIRAALADGSLAEVGRGGGRVPETVRAALDAMLRALHSDTRSLLEPAAFLRRDFDTGLLVEVSERPRAEVEARLRQASEAHVLRPVGTTCWRFAHDLIAEALETGVDAALRPAIHGKLAAALEARASGGSGHLSEVARHAIAAGDPSAPTLALRAAEAAQTARGYDTAAQWYEQALALCGRGAESVEARLGLGLALRLAGRGEEARQALLPAASHPGATPVQRARAAVELSRCVEFSVSDPELVALLESRAEAVADDAPNLAAELYCELAQRTWALDEGSQALRARARAVLDAAPPGALEARGELRWQIGRFYCHWGPQGIPVRRKIVRTLNALPPRLSEAADRLEVHRYALNLAWERCDGPGVARELALYTREVEALDSPALHASLCLRRCIDAQNRGDFDAVHALMAQMRELNQTLGSEFEDFFFATGSARAWFERGDGERIVPSLPMIEGTVRRAWSGIPGVMLSALGIRALLGREAELEEDYARARAQRFVMRDAWSKVQALSFLAEASIRLDDAEGAGWLLAEAEPLLDLNAQCGMCLPMGPLALSVGRLTLRFGDPAEAGRLLQRACELSERLAAPFWLARSRLERVRAYAALPDPMPPAAHGLLRTVNSAAEAGGWTTLQQEIAAFEAPAPALEVKPSEALRAALRRRGPVWQLGFGGKQAQIKHTRGLQHIETLVRQPEVDVHVLELMGAADSATRGGEELVDAQALAQWRQRARDLQDELSEAEANHDLGRVERLRGELDALAETLTTTLGLGGRARRVTTDAERARTAVKQAVRRALKQIAGALPELADHLDRSIRTGVFCVYAPDPKLPVIWSEVAEPPQP